MFEKMHSYLEVCKPRVVATMLFTSLVGMLLASTENILWSQVFFGILGIALIASAAAAINQVADHNIDAVMLRTKKRPIPAGQLSKNHVLLFATVLAVGGSAVLLLWTNVLTTILTLFSLLGYAVIYTQYLKYATPQNIVIGGAAGATPPLLGWVAVTNDLAPGALILFLIIFCMDTSSFLGLGIVPY